MSLDDNFVHGLVAPDDPENTDEISTLTYEVLDDIFHNIIHDMVLEVHRKEKILRQNSAAIAIEDIAAFNPQGEIVTSQTPSKSPKSPRGPRWKSDAARIVNGEVHLTGNPLETQQQILCPKCHLPRLVKPPIGNKHTPPDPDITYCAHRPLVNIPGHDVHGVPFPKTDAKGSRKKQKRDTVPSQSQEVASSFDSPGPPTPPEDIEKKKKPVKREAYPEVKCKRCGYKCAVNIFARHLSKCMGIGGRASGRAAALKMNGDANGNRGTSTPPLSRRSTPLPPAKKSPLKRAASEFDDEDDYEEQFRKKKKPRKQMKKMQTDLASQEEPEAFKLPTIKLKIKKESFNEDIKDEDEEEQSTDTKDWLGPSTSRDPSLESSQTSSSAL